MANRPRQRIGRVAPHRDRDASDIGTFRKIIVTLHMCEMIDEEFISAKTTSYTLKEAT